MATISLITTASVVLIVATTLTGSPDLVEVGARASTVGVPAGTVVVLMEAGAEVASLVAAPALTTGRVKGHPCSSNLPSANEILLTVNGSTTMTSEALPSPNQR